MASPLTRINALTAALPANLTATASFPVDDANGATRKVSLAALRTAVIRTFDVTDPLYGATGDGVTDDTVAIQAAITAAGAAALVDGRSQVYIPGTAAFYNLTGSLDPADNVRIFGDGPTSFLKNTRTAGYAAGAFSNTSIFRVGGYESSGSYLATADTFYPMGDEFRGQQSITLTTLAHAANFAVGDHVFLRSTAKDQYQTQKDVYWVTAQNEVDDVNAGTGAIRLVHQLPEDFRGGYIAVSGLRTIGGKPLRVTRRAVIEDLKLEQPRDYAVGAFSYGGAYECTFRNLDIRCTDAFMVNVMARCTWENINVRFSGRLGEVSYLSHDNTFRHIRATYERKAAYSAGNGIALNEGARDTLFQDVYLNMGDAGTRPVIFGSGRRNTFRDATVISPETNRFALLAMQEVKLDYKPQSCVFDNIDVMGGSNTTTTIVPLCAVEIDSGGPYGGGCSATRIRAHGRYTLGVGVFSRIDVRGTTAPVVVAGPLGSGYGCSGNTMQIDHVAADTANTQGIPRVSGIVEWNNLAPAGGVEAVIDPAWRPGDNVVLPSATRLRQPRVHQQGLGAQHALTLTTLREYRILQDSGTSHLRLKLRAEGTMGGTVGTKTALLRGAGLDIVSVVMNAATTGRWWIEADIGGLVLNTATGATVSATATAIQSKEVLYRTGKLVAGTVTEVRGKTTQAGDTNAGDYVLELQTDVNDAADDVTVDLWSVEPFDDRWSLVNWALVSTIEGGYPDPGYTVP